MKRFFLKPEYPYDASILLAFLRRFAAPSLNYVSGDQIWRVLHIANQPALVIVEAEGDGLRVSMPKYVDGAEEAVAHWLGLDANLSDFYALIDRDAALSTLFSELVGLPLLRTEDLFEALICVIIEQHISWVAAQGAQQRLIHATGTAIAYEGRTLYAMPMPEQIANAPEEALIATKITFKRQALIREMAQRVLNGDINLQAWQQLAPEELYATLLQIKGIGHWTAAVVVARATGQYPYVLHNDVALQAAVNHYFLGGKGRIPGQLLIDTLVPYGKFAGLVAHFTIIKWVLDMYPVAT